MNNGLNLEKMMLDILLKEDLINEYEYKKTLEELMKTSSKKRK
ncbi:hypothetical protein [Clostridium sp. FP2]|nr:hypothetical protein [Clostridium sp. FP2]